jgi:hypothetical protein
LPPARNVGVKPASAVLVPVWRTARFELLASVVMHTEVVPNDSAPLPVATAPPCAMSRLNAVALMN